MAETKWFMIQKPDYVEFFRFLTLGKSVVRIYLSTNSPRILAYHQTSPGSREPMGIYLNELEFFITQAKKVKEKKHEG